MAKKKEAEVSVANETSENGRASGATGSDWQDGEGARPSGATGSDWRTEKEEVKETAKEEEK